MSNRRPAFIFAVIFGLFVWTSSARRAFGAPHSPAPASPPTLTSIAIAPSANGGVGPSDDGILTQGTEVPFFATGLYSDGSTEDLTTVVTWTSSDISVVTIGANTGLAIGVGAGMTEITAALSGVTSAATPVTVAAGTLEGLAITPATGGVAVGATMQLIAYGNYQIPGATNPYPTVLADLTHEVSWSSSNPSVAGVSSAGVVTGVATGTVTITVTMSGFSGTAETASVTVVPAPPSWALTGNLFHQTGGQIAILLNDGTVLIAGGEDSFNKVLDLAEIYTPGSGVFTPTAGNMVVARTLPVAALLPDGTVLIVGGGSETGGGGSIESAEVYNPTTGTFTATANDMSAIRSGGATATLLNSGMVLVAGGSQAGTSADLYNPATRSFTPTGALNVARAFATATLLQTGDVLIAGGRASSSGGALTSAELYDPTTGSFTLLTATMAFAREFHTATLLNDGQVLIAGGTASAGAASTPPAYEELYDPGTQTFLKTGALNAPRIAHNAALLGDGAVLIVGGGAPNDLTGLFGQGFPPQATAELYNPAIGEFTFTANMNFSRAEFTATELANGSILAAGGEGLILFPAPAEIYTPISTTPTLVSIAVTPTAPSIAAGDKQAFTATGTYSDSSTQNITSTVTWASSDAAAATIVSGVPNGGIATGVAPGTSMITATLSSITSNSATLTVTAPVLVSIAVTPPNPSIAKGTTQQFTATGTYSDSSMQNITSSVTWASATIGVATITASGGLATGLAVGMTNITASLSGLTSPADVLTVTAATLQSIAVTPASPSIVKGATQQFTATGTYSDGSTQNITTSVSWASATLSTATIGLHTGLASGVGVGASQITATLGSVVSPPVTLTVTAPVLVSIAIAPTSATIAAGNAQAFTATGTYSDASTQKITSSVSWASSNTTVATIVSGGTNAGVATGMTTGTSNITALLLGINSNTATLTVTGGTATHFVVSAPGSAVAGTAFNFTVTAEDKFNNVATAYAGTVHFTSTDSAAKLPGNSTLTKGTGTFAATLTTTGDQTITSTDTVNSSITGTSNPIDVTAFLSSGTFVIGNLEAGIGSSVTFWGAQWARDNAMSGGSAPNSFKGFADTAPSGCGGTWTSNPGNSSNPPSTVPAYLAVIVSSSVTKSGSTISGNAPEIVIVKTNPGHGPAPGHTGTGTVVGVLCGN